MNHLSFFIVYVAWNLAHSLIEESIFYSLLYSNLVIILVVDVFKVIYFSFVINFNLELIFFKVYVFLKLIFLYKNRIRSCRQK